MENQRRKTLGGKEKWTLSPLLTQVQHLNSQTSKQEYFKELIIDKRLTHSLSYFLSIISLPTIT